MDRLNISLDTLRPERFSSLTRQGRLSDVLRGIAAAEEAGFQNLKLDTVLMGGFNDDEIGDFLRLTLDHPWEVRFIELMPIGPCTAWNPSRFLSTDMVLERFPTLRPLAAQGVARRYRLPGAKGAVGLISPMSHNFCGDWPPHPHHCGRAAEGLSPQPEELPLRGLHGPELEAAIPHGILQKPPRHFLRERSSEAARDMYQIGG